MAPRWPKIGPRWPQDGPKVVQDGVSEAPFFPGGVGGWGPQGLQRPEKGTRKASKIGKVIVSHCCQTCVFLFTQIGLEQKPQPGRKTSEMVPFLREGGAPLDRSNFLKDVAGSDHPVLTSFA